jgi:diguanylate cyclase (GGDEF)-like protein
VTLRLLIKFFIPGSLIISAAVIFLSVDAFAPLLPRILTIYSYGVLIIGIFLGWRFSRSRLIFIMLVLAFTEIILQHLSFDPADELMLDLLIFYTLTFFVPLNIMFIAFIRERGILTLRGIGRLGLICIQPFFIYTLINNRYLRLFDFLDIPFIKSDYLDMLSIPQISLLIYLTAAIFIVFIFYLRKDIIEGGFFWALLCTFLAFLPGKSTPQTTFYLATGGLILIMSILEYSHNVAFRDELTGLSARRSLNDAFLKLPNRYTIAMVDIDKFKNFNDQYGHDVGDQALRMVASKLMKINGGGKAFRYGGEEFTVIFPGKSVNEARPHAELIRQTVESSPFAIRSSKRPVKKPENLKKAPRSAKKVLLTISIGLAERDENYNTPEEVLKAADKALLRAKKTGRNQVCVSGKLRARLT